eukprot:3351-Heterococcus_DN1.PRE.3
MFESILCCALPLAGEDTGVGTSGVGSGTGNINTVTTSSAVACSALMTACCSILTTLMSFTVLLTLACVLTNSGSAVGHNSMTPAQMVQLVKNRTSELNKAIADGRLKPLPQKQLFQVGLDRQVQVAVVLTLKATGGSEELQRERPIERLVYMRLLNVNSSHLPHNLRRVMHGSNGVPAGGQQKREPLRVRSLLVRAKACRSEMAVAQKNINFGRVAVGEHASKTVAIQNRSPGRKGVIPPHRSAEIEFAFRPRYVCIHVLQKYTATVSESSGDSNFMLECCGMSLEAMW